MTVLSHTHPLVIALEAQLLPLFQQALPRLNAAAPNVLASVFAFSTGSDSAFLRYHFGISCLLDDVPDDQPEEVALLVSAAGLDGAVRLEASVAWGQPSGLREAHADLPEASLAALAEALPGLLAALRQALERGRPACAV
ncbi:hypothetical protein [Janthinobacterium psychrotolerans]|uniref:Uncharacterized protein n=1 Tax=Janthinobacterium psychrotolerans TaxID=1747903 RepID=A0A1A7BVF4_9BURK|nr:hypothetical protein [Janthinobacterium psychrotolerans]OBV36744.1 hypothetical protein ASR47_1001217 [Janthinobacterium psychrotolerans]